MKYFITLLFVIGFFVAAYFGYIFVIGKTMKSDPSASTTTGVPDWQRQSQKNDDLLRQQQELLQQRKERMRDLQRR